jgi:hypothetical protein
MAGMPLEARASFGSLSGTPSGAGRKLRHEELFDHPCRI